MVEQRKLGTGGRTAFAGVSYNWSGKAKAKSSAVGYLFIYYIAFAGFGRSSLEKESTTSAAEIAGQSAGFGFVLLYAGRRHQTDTD